MEDQKQILFLGAGSMAEAILSGLLSNTQTTADRIHVINLKNTERIRRLEEKYRVLSPRNKREAIHNADTVILAMKPNDMGSALQQWGSCFSSGQCVISVAAGISTRFIEERIPARTAVIRAMPNTSSMVGASATALCRGQDADDSDLQEAIRIFSSIGTTVVVEEKDMDAVTGLSGSGPAYIYYLVEALEQAGISAGLTPPVARRLTLQTLMGAARMLAETGEEPAELRRKVTSPGGTTMAGLETLAQHHFQESLILAVQRARQRSKELGSTFASPAAR
ncbi:pyrroline-5-carboxylate reductase [Melghirimyces profundicolus]|uniref:Pyrroline-5-carboxylate reductase n=1 Tax=Melghirimyces profundicolus TaxID=1242148 RepID=A0A2T6BXE5_9BACL|nr:pyrroline-5-carboxylate reductase [Melghirimyces profundicolus]PTX60740.1 pyrroline-5-carboxylate reductase [Melghirimyces profundicolus]